MRLNATTPQQGRAGFEKDAATSPRMDGTGTVAGVMPAGLLRDDLRLPVVSSESNRGRKCVSNVVRLPRCDVGTRGRCAAP